MLNSSKDLIAIALLSQISTLCFLCILKRESKQLPTKRSL